MGIFQPIIQKALESGVSPETIVLFLLLPLVVSVVAATRQLIGFRGFGIFIPTAMALVFVYSGLFLGLLTFLVILFTATLARLLLRFLKIQYLPRIALVLWFVSLAVLAALFLFPSLGLPNLTAGSPFTLLILILLGENFLEGQADKTLRESLSLTLGTVMIALIGYAIFSWQNLQRLTLVYPEIIIFAPVLFDIFLGRFTGLRLLEYRRFRHLLGK